MNNWWIVYFCRVAFSLALSLVGVYIAWRYIDKVGIKAFVGYYLVRITVVAIVVLVFGRLSSDVAGWYMHAQWMCDGYCPGIDFLSPYNMGFNWILKYSTKTFCSPIGIILVFTFAEFCGLLLLHCVFERLADNVLAKRIILIYVTSPVCTMLSWFSSQDEALILFGVALFLYFSVFKASVIGRFFAVAWSVVFTKVLALFYLLPLSALKRFWGVSLLLSCYLLYVVSAVSIGINPFVFSFGRSLGLDLSKGDQLLSKFYDLGNVWYVMDFVPVSVRYAAFLVAIFLVSIPFMKVFLKSRCTDSVLIESSIMLFVCWMLLFNLMYTMNFSAYQIPAIPFVIYLAFKSTRSRGVIALMMYWFCSLGFRTFLPFRIFEFPNSVWYKTLLAGVSVIDSGVTLILLLCIMKNALNFLKRQS